MSLKPVNHILQILAREEKWYEQPMLVIYQCWSEVLGTVAAAQARPVSIQRGILWVATSSAAWAQNLTFGRTKLLLQLNEKLPHQPLVDIRFSTGQWENLPVGLQPQSTCSPQEHPSYLGEETATQSSSQIQPTGKDAHTAFQDWAQEVKLRSQHLPLCPNCQCPTPPGELERWLVCAPCAVKQPRNEKINQF